MSKWKFCSSIYILNLVTSVVFAQDLSCMNPTTVSCDFYEKCVESKFACGASGYAIGYGKKYCQEFIKLNTVNSNYGLLSGQGLSWRNSTLMCLQKELGQFLFTSNSSISCSGISNYAFDSHVNCYTLPNYSICDLPVSDWKIISSIPSGQDLLSIQSAKQIGKILLTCGKKIISELEKIQNLQYSQMYTSFNFEDDIHKNKKIYLLQIREQQLYEKLEFLEHLKGNDYAL